MPTDRFFDISTEQSRIKTVIVSKYFDVWSAVMMATQDRQSGRYGDKIAYLDLFAGPGRYEDGTKSTPLMILEKAIESDKLRNRLVTIFNDKDQNNTQSLLTAITQLPGIQTLKYPPKVQNREVGSEMVKLFEEMKMVPTLFFVDPWGYKGLSLKLVNSVLKDWGCDCIFFFNYNRISMGLSNTLVEEHMNALFGEGRANVLRGLVQDLLPADREDTIIEYLCQAIKETGNRFVLPFRFRSENGTRTSHHLIFVSKGFKGYEIMKDIMASESSLSTDGVASFEYSPVSNQQGLLFSLSRPLDELGEVLLSELSGRTLTRDEIYSRHSIDTPYVKKNYTETLAILEASGQVSVLSTGKRRKGTFGPSVRITFPAKHLE